MGGAFGAYGGGEMCTQVLVGKPDRNNHLEDPGVEGRIILRLILRKRNVGDGLGTRSSWLKIGTGGGFL